MDSAFLKQMTRDTQNSFLWKHTMVVVSFGDDKKGLVFELGKLVDQWNIL